MIKPILTAAALSLAAATAAWALPVSPTAPLPPLDSSDVIQVGHYHGGGKNYNKHYNYKHYNYHHGAASTTTATAIGATAIMLVPTTGRLSAASSSVRFGTARSL